jgi:hypothetical protein
VEVGSTDELVGSCEDVVVCDVVVCDVVVCDVVVGDVEDDGDVED